MARNDNAQELELNRVDDRFAREALCAKKRAEDRPDDRDLEAAAPRERVSVQEAPRRRKRNKRKQTPKKFSCCQYCGVIVLCLLAAGLLGLAGYAVFQKCRDNGDPADPAPTAVKTKSQSNSNTFVEGSLFGMDTVTFRSEAGFGYLNYGPELTLKHYRHGKQSINLETSPGCPEVGSEPCRAFVTGTRIFYGNEDQYYKVMMYFAKRESDDEFFWVIHKSHQEIQDFMVEPILDGWDPYNTLAIQADAQGRLLSDQAKQVRICSETNGFLTHTDDPAMTIKFVGGV